MPKLTNFITITLFMLNIAIMGVCQSVQNPQTKNNLSKECFDGKKLILTEIEWKERLTPEQFKILREKGTEPAYQNAYWDNKQKGMYVCAGCALPLFSSEAKYDSHTGWPSFWEPICPQNVSYQKDRYWLFFSR